MTAKHDFPTWAHFVRVRYHGPTAYRGARWQATVSWGSEVFRATLARGTGEPRDEVVAAALEAVARKVAARDAGLPAELRAQRRRFRPALYGELGPDYVVAVVEESEAES